MVPVVVLIPPQPTELHLWPLMVFHQQRQAHLYAVANGGPLRHPAVDPQRASKGQAKGRLPQLLRLGPHRFNKADLSKGRSLQLLILYLHRVSKVDQSKGRFLLVLRLHHLHPKVSQRVLRRPTAPHKPRSLTQNRLTFVLMLCSRLVLTPIRSTRKMTHNRAVQPPLGLLVVMLESRMIHWPSRLSCCVMPPGEASGGPTIVLAMRPAASPKG